MNRGVSVTESNGPASGNTVIQLDHVRKEFGTFVAVHDADFSIRKGEFFSMLGPSGCGKTTLLKMIAGFEQPTAGRVLLEGQDVSKVPPYRRNVNTVFQQYALFPHMTVLDNVAFGLESKGTGRAEARQRAKDMLDVVRLGEFAARRPAQLSGGQQQRVALARALVNMPSALLLDEPLAALDLKLREAMQLELKRIQREVGITFIFVTHDQGEALTMSDRIAVMSQGRVEQIGTPAEIYAKPATVFVASFIGTANLLPGKLEQPGRPGRVRLDSHQILTVPDTGTMEPGAPVTVMLRPERLVPTVNRPEGDALEGTVSEMIYQGATARLIMDLPGKQTEVICTVEEDDHLPPVTGGQQMWMTWAADVPYLLPGRSAFAGATTTDVDQVEATMDGMVGAVPPPTATPAAEGSSFGRRALIVGGGLAAAAAAIGAIWWATGDDQAASPPLDTTGGTAAGGTSATGGTAPAGTAPTAGTATAGTTAGASGAPTAQIGGDLKILNWTLYIDPTDNGHVGTVDRFSKATGIKTVYTEDFNDNNEVFNKNLLPVVGAGKVSPFDVICPTYWMAARVKKLGWVDQLPLDQIPNHANLLDRFLDLPWDPGAKFQMPWQSGTTGIAYNPKLTGRELTSVNDLFDPAFKGKIGFFTEMRDSVGLVMLAMGADPASGDVSAMNAALDKIQQATTSGQIRQFTGNEYTQSLQSGDFVACIAWSGDIAQLQATAPDIQFVFPKEGAMSWFDTMMVPKGSPHLRQAAAWMNFVYDPVQAAQITVAAPYISPVKGVKEELLKLGGDAAALANNPLLFPDEETQKRMHIFADLDQQTENDIVNRFLAISGG